MKLHEYQAKELLAAAGAPIPKHIVARSADEVAAAWEQLATPGGGAMVKAQIHAGGRGAGQLKGYADKLGGVKFASSKEKARALATAMLAHPLVTLQTGPDGQPIRTLIVQADAEPDKEYYVGMVFDRATGTPVLMASAAGGMDIEKVAPRAGRARNWPAAIPGAEARVRPGLHERSGWPGRQNPHGDFEGVLRLRCQHRRSEPAGRDQGRRGDRAGCQDRPGR
jgi:hypothetical protein